jgi:hypothetical protein
VCTCPRSPARPSGSTPSHSARCAAGPRRPRELLDTESTGCARSPTSGPGRRPTETTVWSSSESTRRSSRSSTTLTACGRRPPGERSTIRSRSTTTTRSGTRSPNAWPALYFIDTDGRIRDRHFGEGRYENRSASSRSCSASTASSSPFKASAWRRRPTGTTSARRHAVPLGERDNRWPAPTEQQRPAFEAGHAGSIPVTPLRISAGQSTCEAFLEKLWRTARKARQAPGDPCCPLHWS